MYVFSGLCVTLFLVASAWSDGNIEDLKNGAIELCKKELNAGPDVAEILRTKQLPNNEAQSCFLECLYGKMLLIKDGQLNKEGVDALSKKKFGDDKEKLDKAEEVFKKCQEEVQSAPQEKCYLGKALRKCLITHGEQLQIFSKN